MTILVVDDEPRLRQSIARSLAAHGHEVDQAASCAEALAAVGVRAYDLLLLDVNLPDATGWDVLRQLAAAGRPVPSIVVSAVPPSVARVREFRPVGVLHKPFPIDALLRLVGTVEPSSGGPPPG